MKNLEDMRRENLAYELAKDLKEGSPCPVCGSIHHEVMEFHGSKNIVETENLLKELSSKLNLKRVEIGKIIGERDNLLENLKRLEVYFEDRLIDEKLYLELVEAKGEAVKNLALEEEKIERLTQEKNTLQREIERVAEECKNLDRESKKASAKLESRIQEREAEKIVWTLIWRSSKVLVKSF